MNQDHSMAEDLTGTEVLGFQMMEMIGQGGMATVWRAWNPAIEREVAIKVLDPLLARDARPQ